MVVLSLYVNSKIRTKALNAGIALRANAVMLVTETDILAIAEKQPSSFLLSF